MTTLQSLFGYDGIWSQSLCRHFHNNPDCEKRLMMREVTRIIRGEMTSVLSSRKPTVRIQSVQLEDFDEIVSFEGDFGEMTLHSTTRTQFSKN
ncbi:hypothetical protein PHJA_002734000 [Phtheirospermum japonicum]|uniref:Uncharacterized protein n=1 Tax=Phtheirospermum japonicum TaxID=374723 RepID=A0A830D3N9_9LAMI|nr:hypothetical protein PHJA_002734000 [Phtheirospermum japonicum]